MQPARRKSTAPRWPNVHEWALIGFFSMTFYLLWMMDQNPSLLAVPSFMQFASQLAGGGILLAAAWLYSSTKPERKDEPTDVVVKNPPSDPVPTVSEDDPK